MFRHLIFIILIHVVLLSNAQYSYDLLIRTPEDEKAEFVYHDKLSDEQIMIVIVDCNSSTDTNCTAQCSIYTIDNTSDTTLWPFEDHRGDTLFSINNLVREETGDYFMTGIGWTLDSIGRPNDVFDYNTRWNSNHESLWETIHQRPQQFNGYSKSDMFNILKLINGNYLIGKSIYAGDPRRYYYLTEVDPNTGTVIKEKVMPFRGGYLQGLTYTIDSTEIMLHAGGSIYMRECKRNTEGVIILDTATYDTIRSYCYNRDNDDPEKYWCVHLPYNAKIRKDNKLIVGGTGYCHNVQQGVIERYLFVYQYDSGFNLLKRVFLTNPDTIIDAGWYQSMDINQDSEICLVGNHNRQKGPWSSIYDWIYLAKLDTGLNIISERYLGGDAYYTVYSMAATTDGGMVVAGTRYDYLVNNYERDAFVFKTDGGLWVGQHENSVIPIHSVIVYPNPGNQELNIRTTEYPSEFELYDTQGKLIMLQYVDQHITRLNTSDLLPGFYIWVLKKDCRIIDKGKWIKQQ
ncbi:MAG: T9SS type A sorting domain-containing protein [Chlorobi bacterium]|nr:T9SS type A sorting domain-containing protein [Chlorobiota bacterium]